MGMKTNAILLLGAAVLLAGCLGSALMREASYAPGVYNGSGSGYRGPIRVRVQVSQSGIDDIAIVSHKESAFPGVAAMEELIEEILEYGFTGLDTVSGATFSSSGFLEAVENALQKARQPRAPQ